jgi:hypothetical protein
MTESSKMAESSAPEPFDLVVIGSGPAGEP